MLKIAIDMDGTIANFTGASFKKVEKLYGIKLTKEDAYKPKTSQLVWERMTEEQKKKYNHHNELYAEICDKGFFLDIEPFPGAIEAVKRIYEMDNDIFFLTKTLNWDRSAPEKAVWLERYFKDIDYNIIMVDSVKSKHIVNVDIIIDDDLRVLEGVSAFPICMSQPWNENKIFKNSFHGQIVKNMDEATRIIQDIRPLMKWWKHNGF